MKTNAEISDYYDKKLPYFLSDIENTNTRHSTIKTSISGIVKRGNKVLELGCGVGIFSKFMAQLGAHVTAVDLSPKLIEYATAHMNHENIRYENQDATNIAYTEDFDVIVLADIFEHIPRDKICKLMHRIHNHSHDKTVIYLNIPDGRFQEYMINTFPEILQIVDEIHHLPDVLAQFNEIGFAPAKISIYGIDCPCQYNEIILITEQLMNAFHCRLKKRIKKE